MEPTPKKLLNQVRDAIRLKHYSIRTEQAYVNWIKRYIYFHNVRHPAEMSAPEVQAFLTHLAVEENVAASTQNQALSSSPYCTHQVGDSLIRHAVAGERLPLLGLPAAGRRQTGAAPVCNRQRQAPLLPNPWARWVSKERDIALATSLEIDQIRWLIILCLLLFVGLAFSSGRLGAAHDAR